MVALGSLEADSHGVLVPKSAESFDYSDGDAAELYLKAAIQAATDRSVASDELRASIRDWPSRYHLTPDRANLLRHLPIGAGHRVLEIGAGCGAITRWLGETGAHVVAVEGSHRRAGIARLRCEDLSNVRVACSNAMLIEPERSFDVVTLIGVLEYAAFYVDDAQPHLALIRHARSFLKPGGTLVVAIENQLGLKYFAGCREDHLNRPFAGIEGHYSARGVRTFGKVELGELLQQAGFASVRFQYPYPDYKLPRLLLTDDAVTSSDIDAAALVRGTEFEDYGGPRMQAFDEFLAVPAIGRNRLLGELANSFLVLASDAPVPKEEFVARIYSTGRSVALASMVELVRKGGTVEVIKQPLLPQGVGRFLALTPECAPYVPAPTLHHSIQAAIKRGDLAALASAFARWESALLQLESRFSIEDFGIRVVSGALFDATPRNLLDVDGTLCPIDNEWRVGFDIALSTPVFRYLAHPDLACLPQLIGARDPAALIRSLMPRLAATLDGADELAATLVNERVQADAYPFAQSGDPTAGAAERALAAAQSKLDAGEPLVAVRMLIYAFFVLRDWPLANDAALLCAVAGCAEHGKALFSAARVVDPGRAEMILAREMEFAEVMDGRGALSVGKTAGAECAASAASSATQE